MRGVECFWALLCPEALRSGSSLTLKDKEANALRNLGRLTSLISTSMATSYFISLSHGHMSREWVFMGKETILDNGKKKMMKGNHKEGKTD